MRQRRAFIPTPRFRTQAAFHNGHLEPPTTSRHDGTIFLQYTARDPLNDLLYSVGDPRHCGDP